MLSVFYLYFTYILFINVASFLGYSSSEGWVGGMPVLNVKTVGRLGEPLPAHSSCWLCSDFVKVHRTRHILEGRVNKYCTWWGRRNRRLSFCNC